MASSVAGACASADFNETKAPNAYLALTDVAITTGENEVFGGGIKNTNRAKIKGDLSPKSKAVGDLLD
jgi:hypothetical protein